MFTSVICIVLFSLITQIHSIHGSEHVNKSFKSPGPETIRFLNKFELPLDPDIQILELLKKFYYYQHINLMQVFSIDPISPTLINMLYNKGVVNEIDISYFLDNTIQFYYMKNKHFNWFDFRYMRSYYDFIIKKNIFYLRQQNKSINSKKNIIEILLTTETFLKHKKCIPSYNLVSYIIYYGVL